jgi:hypothetical protein
MPVSFSNLIHLKYTLDGFYKYTRKALLILYFIPRAQHTKKKTFYLISSRNNFAKKEKKKNKNKNEGGC